MADNNTPGPSDALYERLARDAARLLVMHEAGRVLRSTHDPEELSNELLKAIAEALFCGMGCVARIRDDELEILATLGFDEGAADDLAGNEAEAAIWFRVSESAEPLDREELIELGHGELDESDAASDLDEKDGATEEESAASDDDWQPPDDDEWQPEEDDHETTGGPTFELYVPLRLEDREIGVLALGGKVDGESFSASDRELATSLSSQLALALSSSELFEEKETRIERLSVLLRISKEITSTLNIDKVLGIIAGMLSLLLPNRRTVVALVDGSSVSIRASSDEEFDPKTAGDDPLLPAIRWAHGARQEINTCRTDLESDEETEGRDVLLPILTAEGGPVGVAVRSLQDEEGVLGYLVIESDKDEAPIDDDADELATILVNQTSVAIRNAELYQRIPMIGMLKQLRGSPGKANRKKWIKRGIWAAVLAFGLFVPLPAWISGDAMVRPTLVIPVRAATEGTVETIEVNEGEVVTAGQRLGSMRRGELDVELEKTRAAIRRAEVESGRAHQRGQRATYRARQAELVQLNAERQFVLNELERKHLVAPKSGVVLTPHVELRRGLHLARGDTFLEMADLVQMEIEIQVPEHEVHHAEVGAPARFKVQAYPSRVFTGNVVRVAPRADDDTGAFRVAVQVENVDGALRPGMTGRAHLDIPGRPFLYKPLRSVVGWFRLKFWV